MAPCDVHWPQSLSSLADNGVDGLVKTDRASMGPFLDQWASGADLAQDAGNYCPAKLMWFLGARKTMTRNPDGLCPYCAVPENADAWIAKGGVSAAATAEELGLK